MFRFWARKILHFGVKGIVMMIIIDMIMILGMVMANKWTESLLNSVSSCLLMLVQVLISLKVAFLLFIPV